MQLYGFGQSRSFRVAWALEECGLSYDYIALGLRGQAAALSADSDQYKRLNIQSKAPTLVDDDLVLIESAAILNYLARKTPSANLIPSDNPLDSARYDQLCYFVMSELEQPLWSNGKHRFALPEEHRIPAMLDTANFEFTKAVNALDNLLGDSKYAVGEKFTMADILIAHSFNWAIRFGFDVPQKFIELRDFHYQRPAAQKALAVVE
ncbi:MAG: glutathione S-transferase [SAR86 cluster bacterium]|uniref:Glutathione S-transferase n=1 Tax=SAR86 cluster bacterium TaxID=2030880 RepID=A0A2A4MP93_9GAMM|nr:MAG: glutathione S-transferase [SAR86 cluster bacterium]